MLRGDCKFRISLDVLEPRLLLAAQIAYAPVVEADTGTAVIRGTVIDGDKASGDVQEAPPGSGIANMRVFIDQNHNGKLDAIRKKTFTAKRSAVSVTDTGAIVSPVVVSGMLTGLADVNVRVSISDSWDGDVRLTLVGPDGTRVALCADVGGTGRSFSKTTFDDQGVKEIASGSAPFHGTFVPQESLAAFNGTLGNGTWSLEVTAGDSGNIVKVRGWSLTLSCPELSTVTDADGQYELAGLPAGTYTVCVAAQDGWKRTGRQRSYYRMTLAAGQAVESIDFARSAAPPPAMKLSFEQQVIDPFQAGDCKMAGDIDGDGRADLVIGGAKTEGLVWYHNPDWTKTLIATPESDFTTDGKLGDVNGDGYLDVIVPDGDNLVWFENPGRYGDATVGSQWVRHDIGVTGWCHDVRVADFDGDGRLDVAARNPDEDMIFFQNGDGSWTQTELRTYAVGSEGLGLGDVNNDGNMDLVIRGEWLQNPGGAAARSADAWAEHVFGEVPNSFKAVVGDINGDGKNEIVTCSPESVGDLAWWSQTGGDPTALWTKHIIERGLDRSHTLQLADVNCDGRLDILTGQMHTTRGKEIAVWENLGKAAKWRKTVVGHTGIHNGMLVDIDGDGDYDIFGSNFEGNPPLCLWINKMR